MNKLKTGRPVDLSGINIKEIEEWMYSNKMARKIVICQCMIALNNGSQMNEVCSVLGVTRESVRLWKKQFRKGGLQEMLKEKKVGKRSKLDMGKKAELKNVVGKSPKKQGYKEKKWTGLLVQDYIRHQWKFDISLRTAQLWLSKVR